MATLSDRVERRFSVLRTVLDSGERLPCLFEGQTRSLRRAFTNEPWSLTERNRCLFLLKKGLHLNQENAHRLDIWSLTAVHAQRVANFSAVMQVVFNHMPDDPPTGVHVCLAVEFILEDDLQIGGGVAR